MTIDAGTELTCDNASCTLRSSMSPASSATPTAVALRRPLVTIATDLPIDDAGRMIAGLARMIARYRVGGRRCTDSRHR